MAETSLESETVIITGGGSEIGRGIALALGARNIRVVVCRRRLQPLESAAAAIHPAGRVALALQANISNEADGQRLVRRALEAFFYRRYSGQQCGHDGWRADPDPDHVQSLAVI